MGSSLFKILQEVSNKLFYGIYNSILIKIHSHKLHPHILKHYSSFKKNAFDLSITSEPWFNFSMLDFLNQRLKKDFDIFEYGSGNSTIYFSQRCNSIISIEDNLEWFNKVKNFLEKNNIKNANLNYKSSEDEDYAKIISAFNKKYDLIIIDARKRNNCMLECINFLKPNGCIILDNSERKWYKKGTNFLKEQGFKKLDFTGLHPAILFERKASIFYKNENVFDI